MFLGRERQAAAGTMSSLGLGREWGQDLAVRPDPDPASRQPSIALGY